MTLTFRYTEAILKNAIWSYLRRVYLKKMLGLSFLAIGLVIATCFFDSPWLQAFSIVPLFSIPAMLILGYWLRLKESLKRLELLENGQITITINHSGVITETVIGKSETKWKIYEELWAFPSCYLLFYGNHQFITLPANQVSPEFIAFIESHVNGAPELSTTI